MRYFPVNKDKYIIMLLSTHSSLHYGKICYKLQRRKVEVMIVHTGILQDLLKTFFKRRFIEINKTIYRIVGKKDIRNTVNEREESMAAIH